MARSRGIPVLLDDFSPFLLSSLSLWGISAFHLLVSFALGPRKEVHFSPHLLSARPVLSFFTPHSLDLHPVSPPSSLRFPHPLLPIRFTYFNAAVFLVGVETDNSRGKQTVVIHSLTSQPSLTHTRLVPRFAGSHHRPIVPGTANPIASLFRPDLGRRHSWRSRDPVAAAFQFPPSRSRNRKLVRTAV
ncbi:hypothetical protein VTJ04DRAFT_45 [Mycothermus thermophilus]|uniref:uncharacterized protein n=1 Tax=Humicola insolens TaxID=85995 RepID=UPI0037429A40